MAGLSSADLRARAIAAAEAAVAGGFSDVTHFESGCWAKAYTDLRGIPAYDALLTRMRAAR